MYSIIISLHFYLIDHIYILFLLQIEYEYTLYTPFFSTWFCALGTNLFLPFYILGRLLIFPKSAKIGMTLKTSAQAFQEKGITIGKVEFWYHLSFSRKVNSKIKQSLLYLYCPSDFTNNRWATGVTSNIYNYIVP